MSNVSSWKHQRETKKVLRDIDAEIESIKDKLVHGMLLKLESEELVKEYAFQTGYAEGLKHLREIIENNKDDEDDSDE